VLFSEPTFICLSTSLVNEPLQVPQWGPYGERCPFPEPSFTYPSGSRGQQPPLPSRFPNRAPIERDARFPEPYFIYLSQSPVNEHP